MNTFITNPIELIFLLAGLAMVPFIAVTVTSFIKISTVLYMIRNATGAQQVPPSTTINGLSIILSVYIMAPVIQDINEIIKENNITLSEPHTIIQNFDVVVQPLKDFLKRNGGKKESRFFIDAAKKTWPEKHSKDLSSDSLLVLIPAFTVSQITTAFKIAFLIYLPFVAIDLIVSIILVSMSMMMVSPFTISAPFKLFLFVAVQGWSLIMEALILSFK